MPVPTAIKAVLTVIPTLVPTPTPLPGFWEQVSTPNWWANNVGQILGAALGAFLAYVFGLSQMKRQIAHEREIREEEKEAERIVGLMHFFEDTREDRERLRNNLSYNIDVCANNKFKSISQPIEMCSNIHENYIARREHFKPKQQITVMKMRDFAITLSGMIVEYSDLLAREKDTIVFFEQSGRKELLAKFQPHWDKILAYLKTLDACLDELEQIMPSMVDNSLSGEIEKKHENLIKELIE